MHALRRMRQDLSYGHQYHGVREERAAGPLHRMYLLFDVYDCMSRGNSEKHL